MEHPDTMQNDTEQRILRVAEEEFIEKGFDGARTTTIAERAGVTHAMLHYYFRTKQLLFERILASKLHQVGQTFLAVFVEGDMPLTERLRLGVERHFDFLLANPDLPVFVVREVYSHPERLRIMQRQVGTIAGHLLAQLQHHIDASSEAGLTEWVDARALILDVISLNICAFISYPIVRPIFGDWAANSATFFENRKRENVEIIIRRLNKPSV